MDEHEQLIVERVLKELLEEFGGGSFSLASPEEDERDQPAVDAVAVNDVVAVAMEHTVLESFPGQIRDSHRFRKAFAGLEEMVDGHLPVGGYFQLSIDRDSVEGVRGVVTTQIYDWIVRVAPNLETTPSWRRSNVIAAGPPELPVLCRLVRSGSEPAGGQLWLNMSIDGESLPQDRQARASVALAAKCPKLDAARPTGNALTVLVVETHDLSLANPWITSETLRDALLVAACPPPDRIALVDTIPNPFLFEWVKRGDRWPLLDQMVEPGDASSA